jgi:hypothetical protein
MPERREHAEAIEVRVVAHSDETLMELRDWLLRQKPRPPRAGESFFEPVDRKPPFSRWDRSAMLARHYRQVVL